MKSPSILVLGAGGFIGRKLVEHLSRKGYAEIHAIGHNVSHLHPIQGVNYHQTEIDDVALLNKLLPKCSLIFHLACSSTPGSSVLKPVFEAESHILPTLNFLEILQNYPRALLVYLSSGGALYGNLSNSSVFIEESVPSMPLSYYGAGKAAIEHFITALCNQQQRAAVILRPSNIYGPGQTYKVGFGIIPTIFRNISKGEYLQVWGDGQAVRDYLYIDDFVELCDKIIRNSAKLENRIRIYNVGSQKGISLNGLCELIEQVVGLPVLREYRESRGVDVRQVVLDCNKIFMDYEWRANTDLFAGLSKTWFWFKKNEVKSMNSNDLI